MNRRDFMKYIWAWWLSYIMPSIGEAREEKSQVGVIETTVKEKVGSLILVAREWDGKFYLSYFENGERIIHTLASPGKPHSDGWVYTPEWQFSIIAKPWTRRSVKFDAMMPHSLHIHKGIYIHGWTVDGTMLSHGCIRVKKGVAKKLLKIVPQGTRVIIRDTFPRK